MIAQTWSIANSSIETISTISNDYSLCRSIAMILANKKLPLVEIETFLRPRLKDLSDPYEIPSMKPGVERLWAAIRRQERILIFGDYDTDGVTSTALLSWVLRSHGAMVDCYLPHRLEDGYGLTVEAVEKAVDDHKLVITVDCGITSVDAIQAANTKCIDVIITDHHEPGNEIPAAFAVINPKLHDEMDKLHVLAGVGVCFKVCHAFIKFGREHSFIGNTFDLKEGLDLVALGTVADIVPLVGENRCLVKYGMNILAAQRRPGVRALVDISGVKDDVKVKDISFRLAPRLNAAGRVGNAVEALNLLETRNIVDAYPIAKILETYNRKRKQFEGKILNTEITRIRDMNFDKKFTLVIIGKDWHPGVIGIVASRLVQEFNRPTVVLTIRDNGEVLGSGRSIAGVNLVTILTSCEKYLKRFGGHPMATGLILLKENLASFENAFELAVKHSCMNVSGFSPILKIDGDAYINELDERFFTELETIQPFGYGNPAPIFRFADVSSDRMSLVGKQHTQGVLLDRNGNRIRFIAFGKKPQELPNNPWHVAATPQLNCYNGNSYPQLEILDVKHAS